MSVLPGERVPASDVSAFLSVLGTKILRRIVSSRVRSASVRAAQ